MIAHLAEGLLAVFDDLLVRLRPSTEEMLEWLREAAEPPTGVEIRSSDGSLFTGIALFERNRIVVMFAVKTGEHTVSQAPAPQPIPLGPSSPSSSYGSSPSRRLFDPEDDPGEGWPPDPYRR